MSLWYYFNMVTNLFSIFLLIGGNILIFCSFLLSYIKKESVKAFILLIKLKVFDHIFLIFSSIR